MIRHPQRDRGRFINRRAGFRDRPAVDFDFARQHERPGAFARLGKAASNHEGVKTGFRHKEI
jgi:hypothetical protein